MPITQKELANQNSWWENPKNIENDPKIVEFENSKIKWVPGVVGEVCSSRAYSLFVLRGPRQVGKTTAMKLMIRKLLEVNPPQGIFFFDCEILYQARELAEVLDAYFKFLQIINWKGFSFIFLDEVTSLGGWSKVLKFLIDQNRFEKCVLVISGSNALDLKKGADRLPGRRGKGREVAFLPLSFKEYLAVAQPSFYQKIQSQIAEGFNSEIAFFREKGRQLYPHLNTLNLALENYLLCGGFPRLINEIQENSSISYKTYEDYLSWIRGEIAKQKRDEKRGLQILAELSTTLGSKLGWDAIARKIGALSHHTVADYITVFEMLFIGKSLYQMDLAKKRINWRRSKKFYFVDSLVYFLARSIVEKWGDYFNRSLETLASARIRSQLLEQVVFTHLIRIGDDWLEPKVAFWSNASEIDFILWEEKRLLPIEVKWQPQVDKREFMSMANLQFKEGLILSQETLEGQGNFFILPASIFISLF